MRTITIEIERQGDAVDHNLLAETIYLAFCESEPVVNLSINCDQETFEKQKALLRYTDSDQVPLKEGFSFLQNLVTKLLDDIHPLAIVGNKNDPDWLHIRLVISAKELIQIPFELALTPNGFKGQHVRPLLLNPQRLTTLTREVRQSGEAKYTWPKNPRILFAWANPDKEVPYDEHFTVLRDLARQLVTPLKDNPEPIPDIGKLITVVKKASRASINKAIEEGIKENRPYTHIHLLAHGSKNAHPEFPEEFRLMLHDKKDVSKVDYVTGEELALSILESDAGATKFPAIVSLMACDTANTGSISMPAGSVAHQLHESGIPCVFASQFPLSVAGSVSLVGKLYEKLLLDGEDPRKALYHTRKTISDNEFHDWASLVAYVRFPGDIDDQLDDYKLKVLLDALKTSNIWAEHVLMYRSQIPVAAFEKVLEDVSARLDSSIEKFNQLIAPRGITVKAMDRYAEHSGLMGSALKRKAEHLFRLSAFKPDIADALLKESADAIKKARDWYYNGYKEHLKNHWTGIQYLSLAAVTKGKLTDEIDQDIWTVVKVLAQMDDNAGKQPMERIWAWGTLTELYLLKALTAEPEDFDKTAGQALTRAKEYAGRIRDAGATFIAERDLQDDILFAQQTTARQIERYISWWPVMMPGEGLSKLKLLAEEVRKGM